MEMTITEQQKARIEEIISKMECPKGFVCYKSGFADMGKAKDVGMESFVECMEDNPQMCRHVLFFGPTAFCQCPLRVYIAKELKI